MLSVDVQDMVATVISGDWLVGLELGGAMVSLFEKKRKFADSVDICHALLYPTVFEKHSLASINVRLEGSIERGPVDLVSQRQSLEKGSSPASENPVVKPPVGLRKGGKLPKIQTSLSPAFDASINSIPESPLRETQFIPAAEADDSSEFMRNALKTSQTMLPALKTQLCEFSQP